MRIGTNKDTKEMVTFSDEKSRRILICGKTGSGKSYTLGVLLEELAERTDVISVVVDPQGIYWTMVNPNKSQEDALYNMNLRSRGFPVNLLVPGDPKESYRDARIPEKLSEMGVKVSAIKINPFDVSNEMWCDLFDFDINELRGACLYKAVRNARAKLNKNFMLPDIAREVDKQTATDATKEAVLRRLDMATDWGVFQDVEYREIEKLLDSNAINVIDLSPIPQSLFGLRNLVVAIFATFIFYQRATSRKLEALKLGTQMKKVWLALDEAHNFCPSNRSSLSKNILIQWAKEGRQPGLSLIVATQQPSAVDNSILSQCDLRIVHKLTNREDIRAINSLSENYISQDIQYYMKGLSTIGEAIVVDDEKERLEIAKIRPRLSEHGGWGA